MLVLCKGLNCRKFHKHLNLIISYYHIQGYFQNVLHTFGYYNIISWTIICSLTCKEPRTTDLSGFLIRWAVTGVSKFVSNNHRQAFHNYGISDKTPHDYRLSHYFDKKRFVWKKMSKSSKATGRNFIVIV